MNCLIDDMVDKKSINSQTNHCSYGNLSLQLPPIDNSPPSINNFISFYLKSQLKNKNLELNPKMYKDYKN